MTTLYWIGAVVSLALLVYRRFAGGREAAAVATLEV